MAVDWILPLLDSIMCIETRGRAYDKSYRESKQQKHITDEENRLAKKPQYRGGKR